jgi:hypothetical protein
MDSPDSMHSSGASTTKTTAVARFSITVAVTYVGLGFFGLAFLVSSLSQLYRGAAVRSLWLWTSGAVFLCLGSAFLYVIRGLHRRLDWARLTGAIFWLLCLIWSVFAMVRNGLHPEVVSPPSGPLRYSNAEQVEGARLAALMTPYVMALVESAAGQRERSPTKSLARDETQSMPSKGSL